MHLTMLKAKLHRATVTQADLDYEGSISVDSELLEATGILPFEQVDVLDVTNGHRITTYAIPAEPGSGQICVNGAAAHLIRPGDLVIICSYGMMTEEEAKHHEPRIALLDEKNRVKTAISV